MKAPKETIMAAAAESIESEKWRRKRSYQAAMAKAA